MTGRVYNASLIFRTVDSGYSDNSVIATIYTQKSKINYKNTPDTVTKVGNGYGLMLTLHLLWQLSLVFRVSFYPESIMDFKGTISVKS